MKKKLTIIFLLFLTLCLTSCSKRKAFFTDQELDDFGLSNLAAPNNSTDYYNKSKKRMLFCYMNVSKDTDVRNFVMDVLEMLEDREVYKVYGYAKGDDIFQQERKIYLSKDINDYQINTNNYSEDSVTFNSYEIYYSLSDKTKENSMFILTITSYTDKNTNYLSGYNLIISVIKRNLSNYTIITE